MKKTTANYAALLILPLLAGACADLFQEKVPVDLGSSRAGSLDRLVNSPKEAVITELPPPAQLFVETGGSPTSIRLGWASVEGASSYVVERAKVVPVADGSGDLTYSTPADEDFSILSPFEYGLSYTDSIINNPKYSSPEYLYRYYYRVRAQNVGAGLEAGEATAAQLGLLLAPPRTVNASTGDYPRAIRLEWTPVNKAAAYMVYRSGSEYGDSPTLLDRVQGTRYTDSIDGDAEQGKEFYYSVAAVNSAGVSSVASSLAMGYSLMEGAPEPPDVRLAAGSGRGNSTSEIKIEWDPVAAADYYVLYRYSSTDSTLVRLESKYTGTSYTDTKQLKPQMYYYYRVQAVDEEDGKFLKSKLPDAVEAFLLGPPVGAEARKTGGGDISFQWYQAWGGPTEQAAYSYKIYGSASKDGTFTLFHTVPGPAAVVDKYIRVNISTPYEFYYIRTENGGEESKDGELFAPLPLPAVLESVSQREYFDEPQPPNGNGVYPVQVVWTKPAGDDPAAYRVYRSKSPDSRGQPLGDDISAALGTGGRFVWYDTDGSIKAGTLYYYSVLSLNVLGQGDVNGLSSQMGYGALTPGRFFLEYNKTMKSSLSKLTKMHNSDSMKKLGEDGAGGAIGGSVSYDAALDGLGARIIIAYTNYADFYINGNSALGPYFVLNGESNTSAEMNQSGSMDGTVTTSGMYVGTVKYDGITIKGGAAGGGVYYVKPKDYPSETEVDWTEGNK
jgi:fibronectin type 3 domain-containing protein